MKFEVCDTRALVGKWDHIIDNYSDPYISWTLWETGPGDCRDRSKEKIFGTQAGTNPRPRRRRHYQLPFQWHVPQSFRNILMFQRSLPKGASASL